jgi:hypothetical protein
MSKQSAIDYAIQIIESYQSDIGGLVLPAGFTINCDLNGNEVMRGTGGTAKRTAREVGFCQGLLYTEAVAMIRRKEQEEEHPWLSGKPDASGMVED